MTGKRRKTFSSWIIIYSALIAAVVFAAQSGTVPSRSAGNLSPVMLGGESPALTVDSIVRRSDI